MAKTTINGPVFTLTLDDHPETKNRRATDLHQLQPSALLSILNEDCSSMKKWIPPLQSVQAALGCQYTSQGMSATSEATVKFAAGKWHLQVQPSYEIFDQRSNLLVLLARGAQYVFCRASATPESRGRSQLQELRGSWRWALPRWTPISNLRFAPSLHWSDHPTDPPRLQCQFEATTGPRTKTWLQWQDGVARLSLQYAPDSRNLLRPTVDLSTGSIVYQWIGLYGKSSTVQLSVDPSKAIDFTWRDRAAVGSGHWTVEARLPLQGESRRTRVRVKRQFRL